MQRSRNPWLRLSAIMIAMLAGYAVALLLGKVAAPTFDGPLLMVPVPLHYGLGFDWQLFVPLAIIFVVTALEAIGDMTATSDISGEPLEGPVYMARIKGACWPTAPTPCWRRSSPPSPCPPSPRTTASSS